MSNKNKVLIKPFGRGKYVQKDHRSWSFGVFLGLTLGTYAIGPTFNFVKPLVYPVYAVEPSISIPEGVVTPSAAKSSSSSAVLLSESSTPSASKKQEIMHYIVDKFGDDANLAITMLTKCENHALDPQATNVNKNGSVDRGVFQINSTNGGEEMYDWKKNIDTAYKLYKNRGNKFTDWTCAGVIGQKNYLGK